MEGNHKFESDNTHLHILNNIRNAKELSEKNKSVRIVIVVSGNETDRKEWENRFETTAPFLFNSDGSTHIFSFLEKIGSKTREGNFLGTLLAYQNLKNSAAKVKIDYEESVCLLGMLFGRGERISPFTQIEGGRKPAIRVGTLRTGKIGTKMQITALEEALLYFTPVAAYIENRGFKGILDKWGDETEIASIDLTKTPFDKEEFSETDVIKFISNIEITEELARQKDWVVSDENNVVIELLPRNKKEIIDKKLELLKIGKKANSRQNTGVSLGPVAVSYKFLESAVSIFGDDVKNDGVFFDFDPYFLMRLAFTGSKQAWEKSIVNEKGYTELLRMIPDFFEKVESLKIQFKKKHGRSIVYKSFDMGDRVFWADIGQHTSMKEKYMIVNQESALGTIARCLENIESERDADGNIIIDSTISAETVVHDSVIIKSMIMGKGTISGSVITHSTLDKPMIQNAFVVLSYRPCGPVVLGESSGLYRSIGDAPLALDRGMRHGTLLLANEQVGMVVSEKTDLKDTKAHYDVPIFSNTLSFRDAYERMRGISMKELDDRRKRYIESMNK
jgi:hypothetical protein